MRTSSPSRLRLLIADDSSEMRSLVRETIGHAFSEIVEARDGRDLMWQLLRSELTQATDEQLIVTDLCMPHYDGLDVLEAWRELYPDHPTILITAFPSDDVRARAAKLKVTMLPKPFSTTSLRRAIQEATDGRAG
jgi:CheY-like chemotaxis protein